jgi:hypothetical protein
MHFRLKPGRPSKKLIGVIAIIVSAVVLWLVVEASQALPAAPVETTLVSTSGIKLYATGLKHNPARWDMSVADSYLAGTAPKSADVLVTGVDASEVDLQLPFPATDCNMVARAFSIPCERSKRQSSVRSSPYAVASPGTEVSWPQPEPVSSTGLGASAATFTLQELPVTHELQLGIGAITSSTPSICFAQPSSKHFTLSVPNGNHSVSHVLRVPTVSHFLTCSTGLSIRVQSTPASNAPRSILIGKLVGLSVRISAPTLSPLLVGGTVKVGDASHDFSTADSVVIKGASRLEAHLFITPKGRFALRIGPSQASSVMINKSEALPTRLDSETALWSFFMSLPVLFCGLIIGLLTIP